MNSPIETPLCKLAYKYGTDKCPRIEHSYTPYYYELLKDRPIKKVLELGIGSKKIMHHCPHYTIGASLYMWRDFFPEVQIYGIDYDPSTMFEAERIQTFLCHEMDKEGMEKVMKTIGSDIDLVIDDASHKASHQVTATRILLPLLKKDVIYIIEDVNIPEQIQESFPEYKIELPKLERDVDHLVRIYNL